MNTRTHAELANFIWGICNLLRGPYKRNEYRKVILPLTVLRRFDAILAPTKDAVLAAYDANRAREESVREALLKKASGYEFYNTSPLDFGRLLDDPNGLPQHLAEYIVGFSKNVRDVSTASPSTSRSQGWRSATCCTRWSRRSPRSTSRRSALTASRWDTSSRS